MREPDLRPSEDFDPQLLRLALSPGNQPRPIESEEHEDDLLERMLAQLDRHGAADTDGRDALLVGDADLRSVFCDVAAAESELAGVDAVTTEAAATERASSHLRRAAIDAFARSQVPAAEALSLQSSQHASPGKNGHVAAPAARTSERVLHAPRPSPSLLAFIGTRAAAAVLLVGFGVAIIALSGILRERALNDEGPRAEAGLQLTSVAHYRRAESDTPAPAQPVSSEYEPLVPVGQRFAPSAGQVIVFGFGHASHLVLGEGDELHVASGKQLDARLMARAAKDLADVGGDFGSGVDLAAVLRLEAGEAQLDARAGRPVLLAVDGDGLLVLWSGACHVAITKDGPAVALTKGSRARFYRLRGTDVQGIELEGHRRMLLTAEGAQDGGAPAAALFRDLQLFGGELVRGSADVEYRVAATLWRRLGGAATRRGGRFFVPLSLSTTNATATNAATTNAAAPEPARLAFEPVPSLRDARALRIALRAPAGTRVSLRAHNVSYEAASSEAASSEAASSGAGDPARVLAVEEVLGRDTRGEDPGIAQITLDLPADWFARLAGGELVLVVSAPEGRASDEQQVEGQAPVAAESRMEAVFDGVAFVFDRGGDVPSRGAGR